MIWTQPFLSTEQNFQDKVCLVRVVTSGMQTKVRSQLRASKSTESVAVESQKFCLFINFLSVVVCMRMTSIGSNVWTLGPVLVELIGKDLKVCTSWRWVTGTECWNLPHARTGVHARLMAVHQGENAQLFSKSSWTLTLRKLKFKLKALKWCFLGHSVFITAIEKLMLSASSLVFG